MSPALPGDAASRLGPVRPKRWERGLAGGLGFFAGSCPLGLCPLGLCLLFPRRPLRRGTAAPPLCATALPVSVPPEHPAARTGEAQHPSGSDGTRASGVCVRKTSCLWAQASLLTWTTSRKSACVYLYVHTCAHIYVCIHTRMCNCRLNWLRSSMPSVSMNNYPSCTGSGFWEKTGTWWQRWGCKGGSLPWEDIEHGPSWRPALG